MNDKSSMIIRPSVSKLITFFLFIVIFLFFYLTYNFNPHFVTPQSTSSFTTVLTNFSTSRTTLSATSNLQHHRTSSKSTTKLLPKSTSKLLLENQPPPPPPSPPTSLGHIVFGISASAKTWEKRKEYIKVWWRRNETRGYVWLDEKLPPQQSMAESNLDLPILRISEDTSRFSYEHRTGSRAGLRITRIVSEMVRMGPDDVRWYVMGDDDTVFFLENLVQVLRKYDHEQMWYIGSNSETHPQNVIFSYGMAYGGGGFAISAPLAKQLEKLQDRCIERYSGLYGSDDRIHACMAELGVPLTKEPGFHQLDIYGSLLGLLSAHPIAPIVTLHHIDLLEPIFPRISRVQSLRRLKTPATLDSASLMQQSICYDTSRNWTVSVSWGYAVSIFRGIITPRELERPARTFLSWYRNDRDTEFDFNTRPIAKHPCQKPYVHYFSAGRFDKKINRTQTFYSLYRVDVHPWCWWDMDDPLVVKKVYVSKKPDPYRWKKAPRRDCCRILPSERETTLVIDVGECQEGEVLEPIWRSSTTEDPLFPDD